MGKLKFETDNQESVDVKKLRELVWNIVTNEIEEVTKEIDFFDYKIIDLGDEEYGVKVLNHEKYDSITEQEVIDSIENHDDILASFIFTQAKCDPELLVSAYWREVVIVTSDTLQKFINETDSEFHTFEQLYDFAFRNFGNLSGVISGAQKISEAQKINEENWRLLQMETIVEEEDRFRHLLDFQPQRDEVTRNITGFANYINLNPHMLINIKYIGTPRLLFQYFDIDKMDMLKTDFYIVDNGKLIINPVFLSSKYIYMPDKSLTFYRKLNMLINENAGSRKIKNAIRLRHRIRNLVLTVIFIMVSLLFIYK